jgi:ribosome-associated protein
MGATERKNKPESVFGAEPLTAREKAELAAKEVGELKATDVVILDVRDAVALADYFVICTGDTKRHIRALAKRIQSTSKDKGFAVHHTEGESAAKWILMDLNNVVVHIFDQEAREFYELERLWGDAPRLEA